MKGEEKKNTAELKEKERRGKEKKRRTQES